MLGDGFLVVPVLVAGSGTDAFVDAVTSPSFAAPPASALRRFVRDVATVRQQVTRISEALLLGSGARPPTHALRRPAVRAR